MGPWERIVSRSRAPYSSAGAHLHGAPAWARKALILALLASAVLSAVLALGEGALSIGGETYREIQHERRALELVALLQADLAGARAELLALAGDRGTLAAGVVRGAGERIAAARHDMDARIVALYGLELPASTRLAIEMLDGERLEYLDAVEGMVVPALRSRRTSVARGLARGELQRIFARFGRDAAAAMATMRGSVSAAERSAEAAARRVWAARVGAAGLGAVALLGLLWAARRPERRMRPRLEPSTDAAEAVAALAAAGAQMAAGTEELERAIAGYKGAEARRQALLAAMKRPWPIA